MLRHRVDKGADIIGFKIINSARIDKGSCIAIIPQRPIAQSKLIILKLIFA
jgi:hypothetical protein